MRISISSLFITLIVVLILVIVFQFILSHKKGYKFFRSDILIVIALIILIRLLLPIEYPFTQSVYMNKLMNPIHNFMNFKILGLTVSIWLCVIWVIGIIVGIFKYIQILLKVRMIYRNLESISQKRRISDYMEVDPKHDYDVWISDSVKAPMVFGFKKIILLPNIEFSKQGLQNIFTHEMQHIHYHDIWIKQVVNILGIIYWWFLPIHYLDKLVQCVLEIRADDKATLNYDISKVHNYALSLVHVQSKIMDNGMNPSFMKVANCFIFEDRKVLEYRINFLLESNFKKKTNVVILVVLAILPFLTNSIILEPSFPYPHDDGTYSENQIVEDSYLIKLEDGSYKLFMNGEEGEVTDPEPFIEMGIPIIER